jgi:FixJ family two-component response regulator
MTVPEFTVFIVDDDPAVVRALARLIGLSGYPTATFASAQEFLDRHDPLVPGCVILDVRMPDVDGLQLQALMKAGGIERPIVFLTGHGDIRKTVTAMKGGAVDVLTKPVDACELLDVIAKAAKLDTQGRQSRDELGAIHEKIMRLTPREREVMRHVVAGRLNKQIAGELGTVEKTIKVHRGRMMAKMGARNIVELVRITERLGAELDA